MTTSSFFSRFNGIRLEVSTTWRKLLSDCRESPSTLPLLQSVFQTFIDEYGIVMLGSFTKDRYLESADRLLLDLYTAGLVMDPITAQAKLARDYVRNQLRGVRHVTKHTASTFNSAMNYVFNADKTKLAPKLQVELLLCILLNMGVYASRSNLQIELEVAGDGAVEFSAVLRLRAREDDRTKVKEAVMERKVTLHKKLNALKFITSPKRQTPAQIKKKEQAMEDLKKRIVEETMLFEEVPLNTDDEDNEGEPKQSVLSPASLSTPSVVETKESAADLKNDPTFAPEAPRSQYSQPSPSVLKARFPVWSRLVVIKYRSFRLCRWKVKGLVRTRGPIFLSHKTVEGLVLKLYKWELENIEDFFGDSEKLLSVAESVAEPVETSKSWLSPLLELRQYQL